MPRAKGSSSGKSESQRRAIAVAVRERSEALTTPAVSVCNSALKERIAARSSWPSAAWRLIRSFACLSMRAAWRGRLVWNSAHTFVSSSRGLTAISAGGSWFSHSVTRGMWPCMTSGMAQVSTRLAAKTLSPVASAWPTASETWPLPTSQPAAAR